jgi:AcrR family transcriptional regulator
MVTKKEKTRNYILDKSYSLFSEMGFKQVTMKDICTATGLSRGGLYSHFSSTAQVFEALLEKISAENAFDIESEIDKGAPATDILNASLSQMRKEIGNPEDSLSLAIYEYAQMNDPDEIIKLNTAISGALRNPNIKPVANTPTHTARIKSVTTITIFLL